MQAQTCNLYAINKYCYTNNVKMRVSSAMFDRSPAALAGGMSIIA